jgi:biopolymer transport protein ExbD
MINRARKKAKSPQISTASLPDIVFILLFFFMVATRMRETEIKVKQSMPSATEIERLEKKDLLSYIYIGSPLKQEGELEYAPRIQLNDRIANTADIKAFLDSEKAPMLPADRNRLIVCLKVDKQADLGLLSDVKTELRKNNALKIVYITNQDRMKSR